MMDLYPYLYLYLYAGDDARGGEGARRERWRGVRPHELGAARRAHREAAPRAPHPAPPCPAASGAAADAEDARAPAAQAVRRVDPAPLLPYIILR